MIYSMQFISLRTPPILKQDTVSGTIIQTIDRFARNEQMMLYAYCLMPDHLHIVATPQAGSSIGKLMQDFKVATCMAGCDCGMFESLWDKSLYLTIRNNSSDLKEICQFVTSNPIRAGLVSDLKLWRHVWVNKMLVSG